MEATVPEGERSERIRRMIDSLLEHQQVLDEAILLLEEIAAERQEQARGMP